MTDAIINLQALLVKSYHHRKPFPFDTMARRSCVRHPATRRDLTQSAAIVCHGSKTSRSRRRARISDLAESRRSFRAGVPNSHTLEKEL